MNRQKKTLIAIVAIIVLIIMAVILISFANNGANKTTLPTTPETTGTVDASSTTDEASLEESTGESVIDIADEEIEPFYDPTAPIFNLTGHCYTEDVVLKISDPLKKGGEIHYTLDGSEPTKNSTKYSEEGIRLKEGEKQLVKEWESFYQYAHEEAYDVNGYIVKARIFYEDGTESTTRVHTYLINKDVMSRYQNYILCVSGDPSDLTDHSSGILAGASGERGKDSERNAYAELLNADGSIIFEQYIGMRPYGGASRKATLKSFKMYARKDAGSDLGKFQVPEDLFGTQASDGSSLTSYDRLVIRAGGNDMNFGFLRDEMNQILMRQDGYPVTEGSVPVVVYVNGEYYGLFWIHESYCDDYFKDLFPNEDATGEFVVLEGGDAKKSAGNEPNEVEQSALEDYEAFYEKYSTSDLTDNSLYEELRTHMDIENYLDYFAYNIYLANNDWPNNNYKCYRYMPGEGEELGEGVYDGRWRYLPHDMDFGQYLYHNNDRPHESDNTTGACNNSVARVCDPKDEKYAPLFTALMERADCREYFIGKIINLGNNTLSKDSVAAVIDEIAAKQEKELAIYLPVLRKLGHNEWWPSYDNTTNNYSLIKKFHRERLEYLLGYFEEDYGYTREELLELER